MSRLADRRPRAWAAVIQSRELTYREKCYLLTLLSLKSEHVDGRRRYGSKALGPDGKYSLHLDYIAAAMGASEHAVREARQGCLAKEWLSEVHPATHGRPACYQILVKTEPGANRVRVRDFYSLTDAENPHPYGAAEAPTRVRKTPTLTYRDGTDPAPRSSRGLSPRAGGHEAWKEAQRESGVIDQAEIDRRMSDDREERSA